MIASSDYSKAKVVLTTDSWNDEIGDVETDDGWMTDEESQETLWYKYYNGDAEWNMLAFKSGTISLTKKFSYKFILKASTFLT